MQSEESAIYLDRISEVQQNNLIEERESAISNISDSYSIQNRKHKRILSNVDMLTERTKLVE